MKTNFKKLMAMVLAMLMVVSVFSTLATAVEYCDEKDHTWQIVDTVAPTCEKAGYDWCVCTTCYKADIKNVTPKTQHVAGEWVVVTEPGCSHADGQEGKEEQRCTVCDEVIATKTIDALEHKFVKIYDENAVCGEYTLVYWQCQQTLIDGTICGVIKDYSNEVKTHDFVNHTVTKEPTCDEYGILTYSCSDPNCDATVEVKIDMIPHVLVDHEGQAPTCTEKGWYAYQTCENCDYTTYEEIGVTAHNYVADVTAPTCTEKGYTTFTCACGDSYVDNYTNALGHTKLVSVKLPTCTEPGEDTWTCGRCGVVWGGVCRPAKGHQWSDWSYTEGNCQTEATATRTCATCGEVETETFEKGTHVKPTNPDDITATVVKDSTDRKNSYCAITYVCTVCNLPQIEKAEHTDMTYGEIQKYPTCTEEGISANYCGACGFYETIFTDPTDHSYGETVIPPTCTEQGYSTFKCTNVDKNTGVVCGHEIEHGNYVPATGHGNYTVIFGGGPTCTENAKLDITCNACGYKVPESEWLTWENLVGMGALGHRPAADDGDCTTPVLCTRCNGVLTEAETAHTPTTDSTDCTVEVGCTECDVILRTAKAHNPGPAATCKADQVCLDCGAVLVESSPNFHPQDGVTSGIAITTFATCTTGAAGTLFCHLCAVQDTPVSWKGITKNIDADELASMTDAEIAKATGYAEWIIALLKPEGHNLVQVGAQVPTCQEAGWDAYEYCTKGCGYTTYNALPADPDNHSDLGYHTKSVKKVYNGVEMGWARTPSCYADGLVWYYCGDCAAADTTGTYNGWTETVANSIMDCHKDIADYGTELTDREVSSTCSIAGTKYYQCTHTYQTCDSVKVPVLDNGVVVGYTIDYRLNTYTCDKIVAVESDFANHTFGIVNGITFADCENGATVDAKCVYCDYQFTLAEFNAYTGLNLSADALGHSYTSVVVAPTCAEVGYTLYTCSVCGDNYTKDEVDALGHTYDEVVTDPTCTDAGYTTYTCSVCGDGYVGDEVDALGHEYDSVVVAPTCTKDGCTEYTCSVCGDFYADTVVPALGHDYTVVITPETCTLDGAEIYTCQRADCDHGLDADGHGFGYVVIRPALDHDYVPHEAQAPDCENIGWDAYDTCTRCDYSTYVEKAALGHLPFDLTTDSAYQCLDCMSAPSCTKTGKGWGAYCQRGYEDENTRHCADAHEVIPALGHNYETDDITVGCTNYGFTYTICRSCGDGWGYTTTTGGSESIPQDEWVISGYFPSVQDSSNIFVHVAGVTSAALLHQGAIYVGDLDLSKYTKVVIYWGCDNGYITQGHYDANANNRIMLLSADMNMVMSPDESTVIAAETYTLHGWYVAAIEIDLTGVNYNGPVYVAVDTLPGTIVVVSSVEFVNDAPAVTQVPGIIMNYVPELGHDRVTGAVEAGCDTWGAEGDVCSRCGYEHENYKPIKPLGHNIVPHSTDEMELLCDRCGQMVDAHEGHYIVETNKHAFEALSVWSCKEYNYDLTQCTECGRKWTDVTYFHYLPHDWQTLEKVDATVSKDGYEKLQCANCGIEKTDVLPAIKDRVVVDFSVGTLFNGMYVEYTEDENGNALTGATVNGNKLVLAIDLTAQNVMMSNFELTISFNNEYLTFNQDASADFNANNGFANAFLANKDIVKTVSTSTSGKDVKITPDGATYLYLVFDVNASAYEKGKAFVTADFELIATKAINTETASVTVDTGADATAKIYMNGDLSGDGYFDLDDLQCMMDIIVAKEYNVQADINCDGGTRATMADLGRLQQILLNEGVNSDAYEQIIMGTYELN